MHNPYLRATRRMSSMQRDAADEVEVRLRDHVAAHILDHHKVDHTTWYAVPSVLLYTALFSKYSWKVTCTGYLSSVRPVTTILRGKFCELSTPSLAAIWRLAARSFQLARFVPDRSNHFLVACTAHLTRVRLRSRNTQSFLFQTTNSAPLSCCAFAVASRVPVLDQQSDLHNSPYYPFESNTSSHDGLLKHLVSLACAAMLEHGLSRLSRGRDTDLRPAGWSIWPLA